MCIGNLVNKLSKFKHCFKNPMSELLIWFKCVWWFWFLCMIGRMANIMETIEVVESDDGNETQQFKFVDL